MISDLFEAIRPKLKLIETYEDAAEAVGAMFAQTAHLATSARVEEDEDDRDERRPIETAEPEVDMDEVRRVSFVSVLTSQGSTEIGEADGDDASSEVEEPSRRGRGGLTQEEQDDFARELAKLMSEAPAERPKTAASTALPLARVAGSGPAPAASNDQHMAFTLLTRNKGGKGGAAAKTVEVPIDAPLAVQTRAKLLEASEERKQLKKLVLNYERELEVERRSGASKPDRCSAADRRAELQADAAKNGIKVTFQPPQSRAPAIGQSRGRGQPRPPVHQRPAG